MTDGSLGLTATLDLAEIAGTVAVPIEYRKGRPRFVSANGHNGVDDDTEEPSARMEPWPTDRIQVGFQALLLERAGYTVVRGVLYYAAVRRCIDVIVDDALRKEALDTFDAAKRCSVGPRPLPLINDPKCPRCSLQPICLPDEINAVRECQPGSPRKLWPPRDDGIHLVAQRQGTKIGIRGASLRVTESDGTSSQEIPLASVESLSLLGSVQISTQSLHTLADRSIPVAFLSAAGRLVSMVDPLDSVSADTRRNQVRRFDEPAACLALSRQLAAESQPGDPRLADAHDRICVAERRITEIDDELATLDGELVDETEATAALADFNAVWDCLTPREQARVIELLVERVAYDSCAGKIAITFRPTGIKTLTRELAERKEEAA